MDSNKNVNDLTRSKISIFARKHFKPNEILFSSDHFWGMVSNGETSQELTRDAFDVLHYIVAKRLVAGKLTAIDATNVRQSSHKSLLDLAKKYPCFAVAIAIYG